MRAILPPFASGIVSACALTGLGILLGRGLEPRGTGTELEPELEPVAAWSRIAEGGTAVGPAGAAAVLVTFSDFQCPFCARLAATVASLRREYPLEFRMVYRHYPLETIHPHARTAALAAECAAEQHGFQAFHDSLFAVQERIGEVAWAEVAAGAGVPDTAAFSKCVAEARYAARVEADVALGDALGVTGTPTVFLNGSRVRAGLSPARLEQLVAEIVRRGPR